MPTLKQADRNIQASIAAAKASAVRGPAAWTAPDSGAPAEEWAMAQAKRILESAFSEIGYGMKKQKCRRQPLVLKPAKAI
ncbi:MAG: hypothetical protein H6617_12375 [Bdellovibrionaceae bacterium]|nr:hypothetical protein [Bdellovibrionales bacterium]MCB9255469.1 hypothetical protein [Pseudobdellovibrionaceae bacterium]